MATLLKNKSHQKVGQKIGLAMAILVIVFAVLLTAARVLTPHWTPKREYLETLLTQQTHHSVTIQNVSLHWQGFQPVLILKEVTLLDEQRSQKLMTLEKVEAGVNVLSSLYHQSPIINRIILSGFSVTIFKDKNGQFNLSGLSFSSSDTNNAPVSMSEVASVLLSIVKFQIKDVSINFQVSNQTTKMFHIKDALVENEGEVHKFAGNIVNQNKNVSLSTVLTFAGRFVGPITSNAKSAEQIFSALNGQLYISLENASLKEWNEWIRWKYLHAVDGMVSLRTWLSWENSALQSIQVELFARDAQLNSEKTNKKIVFNNCNGQFYWQRLEKGGWFVTGSKIVLGIHGHRWPLEKFGFIYYPPGKAPATISSELSSSSATSLDSFVTYVLHINEVNVDQVIDIAQELSLIPDRMQEKIAAFKPQGHLIDFSLKWIEPSNANVSPQVSQSLSALTSHEYTSVNTNWSLDTYFKTLAFNRVEKIPGGTSLSGHLLMNAGGGALILDSQNGSLDFGPLFRQELQFNHLLATIDWKEDRSGIDITLNKIFAENDDITVNAEGSLKIPYIFDNTDLKSSPISSIAASQSKISQTVKQQASPIINLLAGFSVNDVSKKSRYLPVTILKPKVVKWLDRAIVSGYSPRGTLVLQGTLADFPFDNNNGTFIVDSQIENADLNYVSDWPSIHNLSARLIFAGRSMKMMANKGRIMDVLIHDTTASIPVLAHGVDAVLTVEGQANGELADGWRFLQESPLNKSYGRYLGAMSLQGPLQLALKLVIPLENEKVPVSVQGDLHLSQAKLQLPLSNLAVDQLQGALQFTDHSIIAPQLTGEWLGQPLHLTIQPFSLHTPTNSGTKIVFTSDVSIKTLATYFPSAFWQYLKGELHYQGNILFSTAASQGDQVNLSSDLQGVSVTLPTPLAKSAQQMLPSEISFTLGKSKSEGRNKAEGSYHTVTARYGNRMTTALAFYKYVADKWDFIGGEINFGGSQIPIVDKPTSGLKITGKFAELPWQEWRDFFAKAKKSQGGNPSVNDKLRVFSGADVQVEHLKISGQDLSPAQLQLNRVTHNAWQVGIQSRQATGKLIIPDHVEQTVKATFERLYLQESTDKVQKYNPTDIPSLDIICNDFHYAARNLGRVFLQLRPIHQGVAITQLNVVNPIYSFAAMGSWTGTNKKSLTALKGALISKDFGKVLQVWGFPAAITSKHTVINYDLQWPGALQDFSLNQSVGNLRFDLVDGQLEDIGSSAVMNLGKILNLLSLQSITRRIQLDFSDLTGKGFAFDMLKGEVQLSDGIASINAMNLLGPVAAVAISGKIGLVEKDYHLLLHIQPHLTSSLPMVATLTAGPVVGAVTWVANKVLSPEFEKITSSTYEMVGPWSKPVVQRVAR